MRITLPRVALTLALLLAGSSCASPSASSAGRASAAMSGPPPGDGLTNAVARADSLVAAAVAEGLVPGAVLRVARAGQVLHEEAYGTRQLRGPGPQPVEAPPPMRVTTLFDLASVTKVMATTMALMLLVDRGAVNLDDPVWRHLPEFRAPRFDSIRVRHLLTHTAGLAQWQPLYYHAATPAQAYARIRALPLAWGVGEGRHYSDLGFMLLGYLVERAAGESLDAFLRGALYEPLGLEATGFLPTRLDGSREIAATEYGNGYERRMVYDSAFGYHVPGDPRAWDGWRDYTLVGEVNDGNAWYAHGGVAGHAGLFSTAGELGTLLELLLAGGTHQGRRFVTQATVTAFLTRDDHGHFLGWLHPSDTPPGTFAHTGFTGTYVAAVPQHDLTVVLLTNRQNAGMSEEGYFPNLGPLQRAVLSTLIAGAEENAGAP